MIPDPKIITSQLQGPGDWAFVGGAATLGLIVDGAINIVPLPFFSPGICAMSAAGIALTSKRALDAWRLAIVLDKKKRILAEAAASCAEIYRLHGLAQQAKNLEWELSLSEDLDRFEKIVRVAREETQKLQSRKSRAKPTRNDNTRNTSTLDLNVDK